MANTRRKQTIYIDSIGSFTVDAMKPILMAIMITPNAANSRFKLKESASGTIVVDVAIESVETRYIDFRTFLGIEMTSTFEITELTNIDTVLLYGFWDAPVMGARIPILGAAT